MKFHCDRCKTNYSISEDRVRGKVLKIRCKKCSAIITVGGKKSGSRGESTSSKGKGGGRSANARVSGSSGSAKTAPKPSGSAFKDVATVQNDPSCAPEMLDAAWFLSLGGEQEGPFSLADAQDWIRSKGESDELHCWCEGFDDWLSTGEVTQFRDLARARSGQDEQATVQDELAPMSFPSGSSAPVSPTSSSGKRAGQSSSDHSAATPESLSAPTREAVKSPPPQAEGPVAASGEGANPFEHIMGLTPSSANLSTPSEHPDADVPNLDFDIGEASRIVDLPALMAAARSAPAALGASAASRTGGVPLAEAKASSSGTIGATSLSRDSVSTSAPGSGEHNLGGSSNSDAEGEASTSRSLNKRRSSLLIPLSIAGILVLAVTGGVFFMLSNLDDNSRTLSRGRVGGSGNLAYSFSDHKRQGRVRVVERIVERVVAPTRGKSQNGSRKRKGMVAERKPGPTNGVGGTLPPLRGAGQDEVVIGTGMPVGPTGPLDGDDLMRAYRKNQIAIKMCYERSLKKNPLLKVPSTWVDIRVGLDGRVSAVDIPSLAGTSLGNCMRARIARWKFRSTTETFSSRFRVVFDR